MAIMETDVVVVGAGPCGVTLANHLGLHGIRTIIVDRSAEILDYPRAVGVDDEALRSWQTIGLAPRLLADMIQNPPVRYHNSKGRCFASVRPATQPYGWPRRNMFLQPLTEAVLREGLGRYPHVITLFGFEIDGLTQANAGVTLTGKHVDANGEPAPQAGAVSIQCKYVVGADGGRSTIRRLIDVELTGMTHASKWLVMEVENDTLYAPFSGVYCDPQRPHMSIDLPYGYRRFEFMLGPDDEEEQMQTPESLARLIAPHYPPGAVLPRVSRRRIYLHHSRIAERFQKERVFLAGDAAHLQPPFFGQGMNSGLRDATNLGWKLAAVLNGTLGPQVLETYGQERRGHALAMVNFATWIGKFYQPRNRFVEILRDAFFDLAQSLPTIRDYILQLRFKPMPKYDTGLVLRGGVGGKHRSIGTMFMQPRVERADGNACRLDDALGRGFAVIGVNVDPAASLSAEERAFWTRLGAVFVQVNKSRSAKYLLQNTQPDTLVLDDVDGKFRDWLDDNTPLDVVVLRPDRYVAAVCKSDQLKAVTDEFRALINK